MSNIYLHQPQLKVHSILNEKHWVVGQLVPNMTLSHCVSITYSTTSD